MTVELETILTRYRADTTEIREELRRLSAAEEKRHERLLAQVQTENARFSGQIAALGRVSLAIGAVAGAWAVANEALKAYQEDSQLRTAAAGVDLARLREASQGLVTDTELLRLSAQAMNGEFQASQKDLENAAKAVVVFQRRGFSLDQAMDIVREGLVEAGTDGFERLGVKIEAASGTAEAHHKILAALASEAGTLGQTMASSGENAQRAQVAWENAMTELKSSVGALVSAFSPLLQVLADVASAIALVPRTLADWLTPEAQEPVEVLAARMAQLQRQARFRQAGIEDFALIRESGRTELEEELARRRERLAEVMAKEEEELAARQKWRRQQWQLEEKYGLAGAQRQKRLEEIRKLEEDIRLLEDSLATRLVEEARAAEAQRQQGILARSQAQAAQFAAAAELSEEERRAQRATRADLRRRLEALARAEAEARALRGVDVIAADFGAMEARPSETRAVPALSLGASTAAALVESSLAASASSAGRQELELAAARAQLDRSLPALQELVESMRIERGESVFRRIFGEPSELEVYTSLFQGLASSVGSAFEAIATGSGGAAAAFKNAMRSMLLDLGKHMQVNALAEAAHAIASLAIGNVAGAAAHGKAAAAYQAAALVAGIIVRATSGAGAGQPSSPQDRGAGQGATEGRGDVTIVVGSDWLERDRHRRAAIVDQQLALAEKYGRSAVVQRI